MFFDTENMDHSPEHLVENSPTRRLTDRPSVARALTRLKYILSILTSVVLFYLALWGILKESLYPGGANYQLTGLTITLAAGFLAGELTTVTRLPRIVGMVVTGIILRNLPGQLAIGGAISSSLMGTIRNVALAVIMLKAGMGMDLGILNRLKSACLRLALIPAILETFLTAILAHYLLDFPWLWGLTAGLMLSAVSPAIVGSTCVYLQQNQIGTAKGIPTLILACGSFDDVAAIAGFSVLLAVIFSTRTSLAWTILQGPVSILIGLVYGVLLGMFFWFLRGKNGSNSFRGFLLLTASLAVIFASGALGIQSAGVIGCVTVGVTAVRRWKNDEESYQELHEAVGSLWKFLENALFTLVGASVDLSSVEHSVLLKALILLVVTHVIRVLSTILAMFGVGFNHKEKLFLSVAWLPKATVQAALGSVALDMARSKGSTTDETYGRAVLTLAVLSILLTAPLVAAITNILAAKLLTKDIPEKSGEVQQAGRDEEEINP